MVEPERQPEVPAMSDSAVPKVVSHDLQPGDKFVHRLMLARCTVEAVDDSGHVVATDQRGETRHFERGLINRGLSEGFIQRGDGR